MSETHNKITQDMAGCWLDGHFGWHNTYRVIGIARAYGFTVGFDDMALVERYSHEGESGDETGLEYAQAVEEIADDATDYLNTLAPEGYCFEWDAGELMLWKGEPEDWDHEA